MTPVLSPQPVVLPAAAGGSVSMTSGVGGPAAFQPGIRNTEAVGVLIDKIVLSSRNSAGGANPEGPGFQLAWLVELRWQNELLTNSFVPLPAVCWPMNRESEYFSRWAIRLSKPMWLEPNDYISVTVRNDLAVEYSPAAYVITAAAIGRQCATPPADRWLPFLSAYLGPSYGTGATISDQSGPADLGNPYDTPLFIERLVGRFFAGDSGGAWWDDDPEPAWVPYNVRISDHRDNFWVPTPTQFGAVFGPTDRSWIVNHTLEPKGFLRVEFEGTANNAGITLPQGGTRVSRVVVGSIGYRRIA